MGWKTDSDYTPELIAKSLSVILAHRFEKKGLQVLIAEMLKQNLPQTFPGSSFPKQNCCITRNQIYKQCEDKTNENKTFCQYKDV